MSIRNKVATSRSSRVRATYSFDDGARRARRSTRALTTALRSKSSPSSRPRTVRYISGRMRWNWRRTSGIRPRVLGKRAGEELAGVALDRHLAQAAPALPVVADVVVPLVVVERRALAAMLEPAAHRRTVRRGGFLEQLPQLVELLRGQLADQIGDVEAETFDVVAVALLHAQVGAGFDELLQLLRRQRRAHAVDVLDVRLQLQLHVLRQRRRRRCVWRQRRVAGVARQRLGLVVDVLIEERVAGELVQKEVPQRSLRPALAGLGRAARPTVAPPPASRLRWRRDWPTARRTAPPLRRSSRSHAGRPATGRNRTAAT